MFNFHNDPEEQVEARFWRFNIFSDPSGLMNNYDEFVLGCQS